MDVFLMKISTSGKHVCEINTHLYLTFIIVKMGFAGDYLFFLIFDPKHRLCVLVRTASLRRF